jgi:hypothetical protein
LTAHPRPSRIGRARRRGHRCPRSRSRAPPTGRCPGGRALDIWVIWAPTRPSAIRT